MGQYYMPAIIYPDNSVASLYSHAYGSGLKLMEHSWIGNEFVNAVYSKIFRKPHRIAWIGDYSKDGYETCEDAYAAHLSKETFLNYYHHVWSEDEDQTAQISPDRYHQEDLQLINERTSGMYLVNHDRQEYLDLGHYIDRCTVTEGSWAGYCVNPLPLLTACGNGLGGGDFYKSEDSVGYEYVGIWAFDELELIDDTPDLIPESYAEFEVTFMEG